MRVLIAPDSFKSSLTAAAAARAMEEGLKRACRGLETTLLPLADGGEGTVDAVISATGGRYVRLRVTGPLGRPVDAFYGITGDGRTAIIEMAAASGLPLLASHERDPWRSTSYGTGELILNALDTGCRRLIIGIGGSATNDAGVGMAQALGVSFTDFSGRELAFGGGELCRLAHIDASGIDPRVDEAEITVACDVTNPLCGPDGASLVFSPQKGADADMAVRLDECLANFAGVAAADLGRELSGRPGAGAAGGMGAAFMALTNASFRQGVELIMEFLDFKRKAAGADLLFTGEGRVDSQSAQGKVLSGVVTVAEELALPVIAIGGTVAGDFHSWSPCLTAVSTITEITDLDTALRDAAEGIASAAERVGRLLAAGASIYSKYP